MNRKKGLFNKIVYSSSFYLTFIAMGVLSLFTILFSNSIYYYFSFGIRAKTFAFILFSITGLSVLPGIFLILRKFIKTTTFKTAKTVESDSNGTINNNRRNFIKKLTVSCSAITPMAPVLMSVRETENLELNDIEIVIPNLPKAFTDYKIIQLSDIHTSFAVRKKYLREIMNTINHLDYNMITFTGDFVSNNLNYIHDFTDAFQMLKNKQNAYAVLGNHDFWTDENGVDQALRSVNIRPLRNEHKKIHMGDSFINIIGVDDVWVQKADINKAMTGCKPEETNILLCHNPDLIHTAKNKNINLMLSGHTHGGQVRIPFLGAIVLPSKNGKKYDQGLFREQGSYLYVNRGIGVISPPIRFLCRPEITRITLKGLA